jgi:hypothetical protein
MEILASIPYGQSQSKQFERQGCQLHDINFLFENAGLRRIGQNSQRLFLNFLLTQRAGHGHSVQGQAAPVSTTIMHKRDGQYGARHVKTSNKSIAVAVDTPARRSSKLA